MHMYAFLYRVHQFIENLIATHKHAVCKFVQSKLYSQNCLKFVNLVEIVMDELNLVKFGFG